MNSDLSKILDSNERILIDTRPVFLLSALDTIGLSIFGVGLLAVMPVIQKKEVLSPLLIASLYGFGALCIVATTLQTWLTWRARRYVVTTKRVILQSGIIGRDFRFIDFDQITKMTVNVNLREKVVSRKQAGTIYLSTGGMGRMDATSYALIHIPNAYQTLQALQKIAHDVKTDISFPNNMRPAGNDGYQTQLHK